MQASLLGFITNDYSLSCNRKVRKPAVFTFALFFFRSGVRFLAEILFVSGHFHSPHRPWNFYDVGKLRGARLFCGLEPSAHYHSPSSRSTLEHKIILVTFGDLHHLQSCRLAFEDVGHLLTVPSLVTRVFQGFSAEHKRQNKLFDSEICQLTWINGNNIPFHLQV